MRLAAGRSTPHPAHTEPVRARDGVEAEPIPQEWVLKKRARLKPRDRALQRHVPRRLPGDDHPRVRPHRFRVVALPAKQQPLVDRVDPVARARPEVERRFERQNQVAPHGHSQRRREIGQVRRPQQSHKPGIGVARKQRVERTQFPVRGIAVARGRIERHSGPGRKPPQLQGVPGIGRNRPGTDRRAAELSPLPDHVVVVVESAPLPAQPRAKGVPVLRTNPLRINGEPLRDAEIVETQLAARKHHIPPRYAQPPELQPGIGRIVKHARPDPHQTRRARVHRPPLIDVAERQTVEAALDVQSLAG